MIAAPPKRGTAVVGFIRGSQLDGSGYSGCVTGLQFHYDRGGIHLPDLGLWLDSQRARLGPERVFVSHAHSDHIARHREILATPPTARFLGERLGGRRHVLRLNFDKPAEFTRDGCPWRITALPAGHIVGSAMALVESETSSLLYTGDFKLHPGLSAERCRPRHADTLIMETTFGRPEYVFPPATVVMERIIRFCHDSIAHGESPVLLAYSLGKSQELLCGLCDAGLPIRLHEQAHRMTRLHEEFGRTFPPYGRFAGSLEPGEVLIAPPGTRLGTTQVGSGRLRTAIVTGWALDPGTAYQHGADCAFPLSDHADYEELIEFVHQVNPARVFTLHGFAADFAATLRDIGFDARALSEREQLTLTLPKSRMTPSRPNDPPVSAEAAAPQDPPPAASPAVLPFQPVRWRRSMARPGEAGRGSQSAGSPAGLSCQLHKAGERVALYTEDLRDITAHFPALVDAARELRGEVILDGRLVIVLNDRHLSNREILRRLQGASQTDLFPESPPAVCFVALDVCYLDGASWLEASPTQRRLRLTGLEPFPPGIRRDQPPVC